MLIDKREGLTLEKGCLPFTKRFRKSRSRRKWNTKFWVVQVENLKRTECSKQKFVFHFIKAIFDTSFSLPWRFFGKLNWFVQMVKAIQGQILPVLNFNFAYHLPTEYGPVCPGKCKKPDSPRGLVPTAAWPTLSHVKRSKLANTFKHALIFWDKTQDRQETSVSYSKSRPYALTCSMIMAAKSSGLSGVLYSVALNCSLVRAVWSLS